MKDIINKKGIEDEFKHVVGTILENGGITDVVMRTRLVNDIWDVIKDKVRINPSPVALNVVLQQYRETGDLGQINEDLRTLFFMD